MAQLRLFWVECKNQQENNGDEVYFFIRDMEGLGIGLTNVIEDMEAGERFNNMTDRVSFTGGVVVELYENDPFEDDYIATDFALFTPADAGENQTMTFKGNGAEYLLRYDVIA